MDLNNQLVIVMYILVTELVQDSQFFQLLVECIEIRFIQALPVIGHVPFL